jgi:hypothetical protein
MQRFTTDAIDDRKLFTGCPWSVLTASMLA